MATHSSTLAWRNPWMEEPCRLQSMVSLRVNMTEQLHFHFSLSCIGEGNGNPLQCSCLANPRDGGAWWAAICGVAQSRTRLKRLSSSKGLPFSGKESSCQCRRRRFSLWVHKIPWRRTWQLSPVVLPEESPWTEGPSKPQSMGSLRVRHN